MFKKLLLAALLAVLGSQCCVAMKKGEGFGDDKRFIPSCFCASIEDVPAYCMDLAKKLFNEPFLSEENTNELAQGFFGPQVLSQGSIFCQDVFLENWRLGRVFSFLGDIACKKYLKNEDLGGWKFLGFPMVGEYRCGWWHACPAVFWQSSCGEDKECPFSALELAYKKVINDLRSGWHRATLEMLLKMLGRNRFENLCWSIRDEVVIFVKEGSFEEARLIEDLTFIFEPNCRHFLYCYWAKSEAGSFCYLRIEKSDIPAFDSFFKFDLKNAANFDSDVKNSVDYLLESDPEESGKEDIQENDDEGEGPFSSALNSENQSFLGKNISHNSNKFYSSKQNPRKQFSRKPDVKRARCNSKCNHDGKR